MRRVLTAVLLTLAGAGLAADLQAQQAIGGNDVAVTAARSWLGLVDEGEYEESWNRASSILQEAISAQQWAQAAGQIHDTFGEINQRHFMEGMYAENLPDAPEGSYALLAFHSVYERGEATERVALRLEGEDDWRVIGSFIAPAQ